MSSGFISGSSHLDEAIVRSTCQVVTKGLGRKDVCVPAARVVLGVLAHMTAPGEALFAQVHTLDARTVQSVKEGWLTLEECFDIFSGGGPHPWSAQRDGRHVVVQAAGKIYDPTAVQFSRGWTPAGRVPPTVFPISPPDDPVRTGLHLHVPPKSRVGLLYRFDGNDRGYENTQLWKTPHTEFVEKVWQSVNHLAPPQEPDSPATSRNERLL